MCLILVVCWSLVNALRCLCLLLWRDCSLLFVVWCWLLAVVGLLLFCCCVVVVLLLLGVWRCLLLIAVCDGFVVFALLVVSRSLLVVARCLLVVVCCVLVQGCRCCCVVMVCCSLSFVCCSLLCVFGYRLSCGARC